MSAIYDEKKDEEEFLYVTYCGKNTSQMPKVVDVMMDNPLMAASYGIGVDSRKEWDMKEDENALILRIPIPGFDIKISVEQNMLVVKGVGGKESEDEEDGARSFYSQLDILPKLYKMDSIKVDMKNGVLKIKIPKVEEEQEDFFEVMID